MFNAIGTVFNTFWPRLATVFLDLCISREGVQRFCDNDMQKNNLRRVARSNARRFRSDRAAVPGDLSDWNRLSGHFDLKVRRSGAEPLSLASA
ncbi:hypothetical protein [Mesorhizobium sp.]|uniref:hypothetical protein n=1 Tax=Mesorhizobium sp. TaxID=1871066 RepID=UPI000FE4E78A|nr:hypothetical protein [Mesorhizobium sp.]RWK32877.1 MAG: hypothetical protein EOR46_29940 [Mesorhizobium sp.]RWK69387.1 MAG: hypothetical protein EOR54_10190 [Mesorhizobium sp.]RWK69779.1 MAG: hypothetical protein EOR50_34515 [Mesorhizobium sp.]RWK81635.1 MAG: hypothetical protein EOR51_14260 [Mesorhizobium sp.]RWK99365.1 MAG: hypothetical protein EOR55_32750 [Mesorhizobium sp.]